MPFGLGEALVDCEKELQRAKAALDAIEKYAVHIPTCDAIGDMGECWCGLDDALALVPERATGAIVAS